MSQPVGVALSRLGGGLQSGEDDQGPYAQDCRQQIGAAANPGNTGYRCGMDGKQGGGPGGDAIAVTTSRQQVAAEGIQADDQEPVQQDVFQVETERAVTPQPPADAVRQQGERLPGPRRTFHRPFRGAGAIGGPGTREGCRHIGQAGQPVSALQYVFPVTPDEVTAKGADIDQKHQQSQ